MYSTSNLLLTTHSPPFHNYSFEEKMHTVCWVHVCVESNFRASKNLKKEKIYGQKNRIGIEHLNEKNRKSRTGRIVNFVLHFSTGGCFLYGWSGFVLEHRSFNPIIQIGPQRHWFLDGHDYF